MLVFMTALNFITMIPITGASFALPDNSDFDIDYYNNTQCLGNTFKSSTVKSFCLDSTVKNGFPKCCYDTLENVGLSGSSEFDTCYSFRFNDSAVMGVKYDCKLTKYQNMTYLEVFGIIGIGSLVILLFLIGYCVFFRCCVSRNGYNTVGV